MTIPAGASPASSRVIESPLIDRYAAGLARLWPERRDGDRLGLAVSGGPDSTALLLLAHAALPHAIEVATVDHRLRPESAAETDQVRALCERLGVPHATLGVDVPAGNVQAQARRARYAALAGWLAERGLAALATGHHADDQAETLLLRLNRASGVAGLAGTRARGFVPDTRFPLLRPLLDWRREELATIVAAAGVAVASDPSNDDPRYDRARIRRALTDADWLDVPAIAASAAHLADADTALDWAARREWDEQVRETGLAITYRPRAPRAVALRVIARIVATLGEPEPRGGAVATVFDALVAGRPASIGALVARPMAEGWSFTKAPRRAGR